MKTTTKKKVAKLAKHSQAPQPPVPMVPAPVTATLSPKASELVRWYCGITRHREEKTVEGAVYGALDRAKAAYEDGNFHDEAFNFLLEDVIQGMRDEERRDPRAWDGGLSTKLDVEASTWIKKFEHLNGLADLRDVVSAAVVYALRMTVEHKDPNRTVQDTEEWEYFQEELQACRQRREEGEGKQQRLNANLADLAAARKGVAAV